MERLEIAGNRQRFPPLCACCLEPSQTTVPAQKTRSTFLVVVTVRKTYSLPIPYCEACSNHVSRTRTERILLITFGLLLAGLVGMLATGFLGAVLPAFAPEPLREPLQTGLAVVSLLFPIALPTAYLARALVGRARPATPPHTRWTESVEVLSFSDDGATLGVHNPTLGELLRAGQAGGPGAGLSPAARAAAERAAKLQDAAGARFAEALRKVLPVVARSAAAAKPPVSPRPAKPPDDAERRRLELTRDASPPRDPVARAVSRFAQPPAGRAPAPEAALRFAAFRCELGPSGLTASYRDGTRREVAWRDVTELFVRQLPPDPPWERAIVVDLLTGPREQVPPLRLLSGTFINFAALPEGASTSRVENVRRLAAFALREQPALRLDPETAAFVREGAPCPGFRGMREFSEYDARYG